MHSSITSSTLRELNLNGWCVIESSLSDDTSKMLSALGPIVPSRQLSLDSVDLKPYEKNDAPRLSMSENTGTGSQPMHTDAAYYALPPRYIALQCIDPGEATCPTLVNSIDLTELTNNHREMLSRPDWIVNDFRHSPFYCSILDVYQGFVRLRFDPICMHPAGRSRQTCEEAMEIFDIYSQCTSIEWECGKLLLIDNWCCLHARGNGADKAPSRRLRRWQIGVSNGLVIRNPI
jgi:hypothetical protein